MSGEPDAWFRDVYQAELSYVLRTVRRLGVAEADGEDVVHDVFVVVHRRQREFERGRPIRPWLFGIAYRVVGNHFQKAHRRAEVRADAAELEARADDAPRADQQIAEEEVRNAVLRALGELDLEQRAVCVLCDLEQVPATAAAVALGIPVNTVYSRLRTARQKVAATLRRMRVLRGEP